MPTLAEMNLPTPQDWEEFENIVLSVAKIRWNCPNFTLHGRQGQKQEGVDIYGQVQGQNIGIQCKKSDSLSEKIIKNEIKKAESFSPNLSQYFIATSMVEDVNLQKIVREISAARLQQNKFSVDIVF